MDNAARALVMAASIILGVLLFSAFMYVFRAGASLDETYDAAQNKRQLDLFNSRFDVYDKNDNTIMDLITVANNVYNVNKDYNYDPAMTIELIIKFILSRSRVTYLKTEMSCGTMITAFCLPSYNWNSLIFEAKKVVMAFSSSSISGSSLCHGCYNRPSKMLLACFLPQSVKGYPIRLAWFHHY